MNDCKSVRLLGASAERANVRSHPDCVSRRPSRLNNDICSLTHTEGDDLGLVGDDRHKIIGNDFERVVVDTEPLQAFCASIYQSEFVKLPCLKEKLRSTRYWRAVEHSPSAVVITMLCEHQSTLEFTVVLLAIDQVVVTIR